jgi:uncharacterized membrane protein
MPASAQVFTSQPYRSLSPRGYKWLFRVVVGVNLIGAVVVAAIQAWPVLPFMGLDIVALYFAFRASYGQAHAFERISIDTSSLTVIRSDVQGHQQSISLPSYWAQVVFQGDGDGGTIKVRSHGHEVEVGRFLPGPERELFADALRKALADSKSVVQFR